MTTVSGELDGVIHEIACMELGNDQPLFQSDPTMARFKETGTELWIDTGDLEKAQSIWKSEFTALTTNNTLANQVVQTGVMDEVIHQTISRLNEVASGLTEEERVTEVGFVINCRIALRLVRAFKTKVSIELHPSMSRNIGRTIDYARRYYRVCPEYFIVKIPLTPEGYLSVRTLRKEGMPINFTLGFSARQNYLAARLSNPDFVNVFLGRLNQVVSENSVGGGDLVGEKVTLATQEALLRARKQYSEVGTRLIGASIRSGEQVAFLAGLDVMTIPPSAMAEFLEMKHPVGTMRTNIGKDINPGIDFSHPHGLRFHKLWEVPDAFVQFVNDLLASTNLDSMNGRDMESFCREKNVDLFYPFSPAQLKKILDLGKIPRLDEWSHEVALDDLMTQSALQSFSKDQAALDDRIRSFL
ncbi:transaldolase family protein [Nitrospinaceae bacterium]|nr:transaldolase family protein [Nitrospinaceae bacterium]